MKRRLLTLMILTAFAAAPSGAWPQAAPGSSAGQTSAPSDPMRRIERLRLKLPPLPPAAGQKGRPTLLLPRWDETSGAPLEPDWFKSNGQLGWGASRGGEQTVLGIYQRPARPDIPAYQTSSVEAQGAAGVSWTLKLGR